LPYEIYTVIGEWLTADNALRTLAHLNQASKAVREETLPVLCETMRLEDDETFLKSTLGKDCKGFKYVK
jgi:hypothetical protein